MGRSGSRKPSERGVTRWHDGSTYDGRVAIWQLAMRAAATQRGSIDWSKGWLQTAEDIPIYLYVSPPIHSSATRDSKLHGVQ